MQIIKHDSYQLIFKKEKGFSPFLLIWGLFFGGIPLFMFVSFFSGLGVIDINCERVEITQVNCQVNQSNFTGLKTEKSRNLTNVTVVKFEQIEGVDSDDQRTVDNQIILENKQGEKILIEDSIFVNGVRGNEREMRLITSQMQNFLNSQDIYLTVNYDNRWRRANLFIFGFFSLFIIIGGSVFIWNIISIGYEKFTFNKSTSKFSFERVNLLGKKKEIYTIRQINSIILRVYRDSDGDEFYSLIVPVSNKKKYILAQNSQMEIIQANADKIANFLEINVITEDE